jgi:hypothetical protein
MNIFIIHIGITRPHFCFDCTNFKASLVIKIINFNEILKMSHLAMLVIFYEDVISCQNLIYYTFIANLLKKPIF